jgi:hypothetical protein
MVNSGGTWAATKGGDDDQQPSEQKYIGVGVQGGRGDTGFILNYFSSQT